MNSYSQDIYTTAHKYTFQLKYKAGNQTKNASGVKEGSSADAVILQLLIEYPNSTGTVKRLKK